MNSDKLRWAAVQNVGSEHAIGLPSARSTKITFAGGSASVLESLKPREHSFEPHFFFKGNSIRIGYSYFDDLDGPRKVYWLSTRYPGKGNCFLTLYEATRCAMMIATECMDTASVLRLQAMISDYESKYTTEKSEIRPATSGGSESNRRF